MLRIHVAVLILLALAVGVVQAQPAGKATDQPPHPQRILADAVARNFWFGPDHSLTQQTEASAMLAAILKGGSMGGSDGWFGAGSSRYSWQWLAKRHGIDATGAIDRKAWRGAPQSFDSLDRNHDGVVTMADFDWSDKTAASREERSYRQWFAGIDADSNGKISRKEWDEVFERLAKGKDYLHPDDLRRAFPLPGSTKKNVAKSGKPPSAKQLAEFQQVLLKGFLQSELGSPFPGPRVGEAAPDFTLATHDGKQTVTLSDYQGHKPVVLIFGNFT